MKVVERYTPSARWFHWLIVGVFIELVLSGLLIFIPWQATGMVGTWIRIIHRIGAVILIGAPAIFALFSWRRSWYFIKEGFIWGKEDLDWLKAAPSYYFGGDPRLMPPQGYINTGMKLYRLTIILGSAVFVLTGLIMWFLKGIVPPELFQWCVILHDIAFIVAIGMFLLHVQLSVFHPRMDESLLSMVDGKVSGVYAKSHHGKWYDKVAEEEDSSTSSASS
jgi:formate dehydrogenase subunit gamma